MKIENLTILTADKGKIITEWDGNDIRTYYGGSNMYCPEGVDITKFYEISENEHLERLNELNSLVVDSSIVDYL